MITKLKIREVREKLEINQIELSKKAGISQSYLSELERNLKSPTLKMLDKIANALNVSPDELIYYE